MELIPPCRLRTRMAPIHRYLILLLTTCVSATVPMDLSATSTLCSILLPRLSFSNTIYQPLSCRIRCITGLLGSVLSTAPASFPSLPLALLCRRTRVIWQRHRPRILPRVLLCRLLRPMPLDPQHVWLRIRASTERVSSRFILLALYYYFFLLPMGTFLHRLAFWGFKGTKFLGLL